MAEPWQCPACKTWIAPHVKEHRCDPEGGVGALRPAEPPSTPTMITSVWPTGGVITTGTTGWTATNVTVTFDGTPLRQRQLADAIRQQAYRRRNAGPTLRVA